jgi:hypothetical protein
MISVPQPRMRSLRFFSKATSLTRLSGMMRPVRVRMPFCSTIRRLVSVYVHRYQLRNGTSAPQTISTAAIATTTQPALPSPLSPISAIRKPAATQTTSSTRKGRNNLFTCVRVVSTVCSPSIISLRGRLMGLILSLRRTEMGDVARADRAAVDEQAPQVVDAGGLPDEDLLARQRDPHA